MSATIRFRLACRPWTAALLAVTVLAAACGGDDDAGAPLTAATIATTAPAPTTGPDPTADAESVPTTAPPVASTTPATTPATTQATGPDTTALTSPPEPDGLPVELASEDGFVRLRLPAGWEAVNVDRADTTFEPAEWSATSALDELLAAAGPDDSARILVARDRRYLHNPGLPAMNREFLTDVGVAAPDVEASGSPLGDPGSWSSTVADDLRITLHTAQIDGQYLAVLAVAPLDDPLSRELDAILASVTVDAAVVGPLGHARESELAYNPDGDDTDEFLVSLLVPADWAPDPADEFVYQGPDGSWISQHAAVDPATTLEAAIAAELGGLAGGWLDAEPLLEPIEFNGVPYTIAWEGPPGEAVAAILIGYDGVLVHTVYLSIDDPELLVAVIGSVWVSEHA